MQNCDSDLSVDHKKRKSSEQMSHSSDLTSYRKSSTCINLEKIEDSKLISNHADTCKLKEGKIVSRKRTKINKMPKKEQEVKNEESDNYSLCSEQNTHIKKYNNNDYDKNDLKCILKSDKKEMFCIFKSNFINEHKVTIGDIVQTEKLHRKKAGDVVYFGTILFIGSKTFSIIGKPTISFCKVKAVIEQVTLSKEILSFRYKKVRRSSKFLRIKHWVTILKIQDFIFDFQHEIKDERIKPLNILDLWSNRWLYQKELNFIKYDQNKNPLAEQIYNIIEHQPNTLHRRGLTECYRFYPDPYVPYSY